MGSPHVDQLLTLIQFNVFRAFLKNTVSLGFTMEWLESEEAVSPFCCASNSESPTRPTSLQPTLLQVTVPHHPWIDLIPHSSVRDNILYALKDDWDDSELCRDLVEFCQEPKEQTGMIIWGEPWDPSGWEVTEGFLKKHAWTIMGCTELLMSTNYWRLKRGERKLFPDIQWK